MDQFIDDSSLIELFPLMIIDESIEKSELNAFYFYSDTSENMSDLRYICPYPNIETIKLKSNEIFKERCRD